MNFTDLVPRLLAGEEDAIVELVDGARSRLASIAYGVGANAEDAQEIALDVLVATLSRLPAIPLDRTRSGDPLLSYMAKAAKNGAADRFRKAQADRRALAKAANVSGEVSIFSHDDQGQGRLLWAHSVGEHQADVGTDSHLLDELDEIDRQIAEWRAFTTLTWEEIAQELSMNSAQVRKRWERIRRHLRTTSPIGGA